MVSNIDYRCRPEGQEEWDTFSEHSCRSLEGVAMLYGNFKKLPEGTKNEVSDSPNDKKNSIKTYLYKKH
jgi:hypothetical protein